MRYRIRHTTRYFGNEPVSVGHNEAWLTPRQTPTQQCLSHALEIIPEPSIRSIRTDYFGNTVTQFSFNQGYDALTVAAIDEVDVVERPAAELQDIEWESVVAEVAKHETAAALAAYEFIFDSSRCRVSPDFAEYGRLSFRPNRGLFDGLRDLLARFRADFHYDSNATTVSTPVEDVFRDRRGVCQDFAHLLNSILRSLGLPARYVSGYLRTSPPPGKPRLVGADASHAWTSIYAGPSGWIDVDAVNNCFAGTGHITVAWGRDYDDVAPLKGVYVGGGTHQLSVSVDVVEVAEPDQRGAATNGAMTGPSSVGQSSPMTA
jgi:transglutaminase-like putative cysteine protease